MNVFQTRVDKRKNRKWGFFKTKKKILEKGFHVCSSESFIRKRFNDAFFKDFPTTVT